MPDRENVPRRVNVAVVSDTTLTSPFSYSKAGPTFRTTGRECAAMRTGLGGVRFVDLTKNDACAIALVRQHRFQHAPTGVVHRLGHFGLSQRFGLDVANNDQPAPLHKRGAEFVKCILATVRDLGVDGSRAGFLAGTLGSGQLAFKVAVEPPSLKGAAIATGRCGFQPKVDTDFILSGWASTFDLNTHVEVPTATGIFAKATGAKLELAKAVAVPYAEVMPVKVELPIFPDRCALSALEGNPTQRPASAPRLPPGQPRTLSRITLDGVLFLQFLHSAAMQAEQLAGTFGVRLKIKAGQESPVVTDVAIAQFVQVIPDSVNRPRPLAQNGRMPVLDAQLEGFGGFHSGLAFIYMSQ